MIALRFGFQNQVIVLFNGTRNGAAEGNFLTGQILCRRMVNIESGGRYGFSGIPLIDFRL